jgi:hypothetical protein
VNLSAVAFPQLGNEFKVVFELGVGDDAHDGGLGVVAGSQRLRRLNN